LRVCWIGVSARRQSGPSEAAMASRRASTARSRAPGVKRGLGMVAGAVRLGLRAAWA